MSEVKESNVPGTGVVDEVERFNNSKRMQLVRELSAVLKEKESKPNILTLAQWRKYCIFYQKKPENMTDGQALAFEKKIDELWIEYRRIFDPYKPTIVVDNLESKRIIERLPRMFVQTQTITASKHGEKAMRAVLKNRASGNSDIPRYAAEACDGVSDQFEMAQLADKDHLRGIAVAKRQNTILELLFLKRKLERDAMRKQQAEGTAPQAAPQETQNVTPKKTGGGANVVLDMEDL